MIARSRLLRCALIVAVTCASATASADGLDDLVDKDTLDLAKTLAKRSLRRVRRGLALGPLVGAAPVMDFAGDSDLQLSFGLALLRFDIPLTPTPERIVEIIKDRVKDELKARVRAAIERGETMSEEDQKRLARELWQEIKAEFLLELRPKRFEKPSFALLLEVDHLFAADAWDVRGTLGLGVGPVYLSSGLILQIDDGAALVVPVEIAVPMMVTRGLRSPVVDFFVRADFAVTRRDTREDRAFVGARFMLDII